jgi:hypothetical protein
MANSLSGVDGGSGFGVKGTSSPPHVGKGGEGISTGGHDIFGQTKGIRAAGVRRLCDLRRTCIHSQPIAKLSIVTNTEERTPRMS